MLFNMSLNSQLEEKDRQISFVPMLFNILLNSQIINAT